VRKPPFIPQPVILQGKTIRVEPAEARHVPALLRHGELNAFRLFGTRRPAAWSQEALADYVASTNELPNVLSCAMVLQDNDDAVGMSSFMDIRPADLGLEIGMTWIAPAFRGTTVNPECKLLMLRHAFETLGCERVQLKTDLRNVQSQRAIEKLGAKKEGILRRHIQMPDGHMRDTVMYSVVREEWPEVEKGLLSRLA
jgi:RimJ/RimL family protein N-acetyltransferase